MKQLVLFLTETTCSHSSAKWVKNIINVQKFKIQCFCQKKLVPSISVFNFLLVRNTSSMKQVLSKVLCLKKTPQTHVPRSCRSVCGSCSCVSCSSCLCLLVSESQKHEMTGCCPFTFLLHLGNTSNKHKVSACYLYY